jgi:hypothetical protein
MVLFLDAIAFGVTLLALVAGTLLLSVLNKLEPCCKTSAKVIGYIVVILSILQLLCLSYHTVLYSGDGLFKPRGPGSGSGMMMNGGGMNKGMMMQNGKMPGGMNKMMMNQQGTPNAVPPPQP